MPDILFTFITIATPIAVAVVFIVVLTRSARLLPQEIGKTPVYRERTGARLGSMNFTTPFVRVAVYEDLLVLAANEAVLLTPADIVSVQSQGHLFSRGVRIIHNHSLLPDPLIVWTTTPAPLVAAVQRIQERHTGSMGNAPSSPGTTSAPRPPSPIAG